MAGTTLITEPNPIAINIISIAIWGGPFNWTKSLINMEDDDGDVDDEDGDFGLLLLLLVS